MKKIETENVEIGEMLKEYRDIVNNVEIKTTFIRKIIDDAVNDLAEIKYFFEELVEFDANNDNKKGRK